MERFTTNDWLLVAAIAIALMMLTWITPAGAHDWYESACCSGKDCMPVKDGVVTETADGVRVEGFGILSESDSRLRWSQDDRDHICAFNSSTFGAPVTRKLQCVYRKRKFM